MQRLSRYHIASFWLSVTTAGIAGLVLCGWAFGLTRLTSLSPDFVSMKVTTAAGLLCLAAAVLLVNPLIAVHLGRHQAIVRSLTIGLATVSGLVGLSTLLGYAANVQGDSSHPAWMAPATALSFILFAVAVVAGAISTTAGQRISDMAGGLTLLVGSVALLGYLYDEESLYAVGPYSSMAIHTAAAFVALTLAFFCARPERGLMARFTDNNSGGLMMRRMLPMAAGMMVAIGWMRLLGEQTQWFDAHFGLTFVIALGTAAFGAILWSVAGVLNQTDADQRRSEKALRQSEQRLRFALEACSIGAWDIDLVDHTAFRSLEHDRVFGYSELLPSWTLDDFLKHALPEYHEPVVKMVREATAARTGWTYECRIRRVDGEIRWIWFSGRIYTDDRGHDRVAGVVQDITGRKQVEAAIAEQRRLYQSVTDNASVGLFIMDEHQQCRFMNPAAEALTGYTLAETRGRALHDVVHHTRVDGRPYPLSECPIDQAFPEENQMQGEETFVHKDGRFYPVAFTASPIRDAAGKPVGTIIEVQDISERKQAEAALREAHLRLQRWNEELEQAVNVKTQELVHSQERLRAMASELNLAELRERKRLASELHDHLQQSLVLAKLKLGQGRRLADAFPALNQVLKDADEVLSEAFDYTRTLVAELSPTVLRDHGLAAGLKWLGEYMKKRDLTVTVTAPEEEPSLPEDQVALLFQSARELLINSSKYAGIREASVRVEQQDGRLAIEVKDHGLGFDLAALTGAVGETTDGLSSKFGLLSIRERMKALGGSIDIETAPGKGTTARLVLPLPSRSEAGSRFEVRGSKLSEVNVEHRASNLDRRHQPANRVRVLLVDDHMMVRQGLRAVLDGSPDIELVGEASDGAEAVALAESLRPAVVVMDINMPRMNGIEATARIKARHPDTVVIGLSVNAGGENQEAMKKAGAALLITKEAAVEQLYDAIQQTFKREVARGAD